jgi:hypothetical protein
MTAYPNVTTTPDGFTIPPDAKLVVPWELDTNDIRRDTRAYALLNNGTIMLLPPLSIESHAALFANIDQAQAISHVDGSLMARVVPVKTVTFDPAQRAATGISPLISFGQEVALLNVHGPDTLSNTKTVTYTLIWQPLRLLGHYYSSFLQLQTQESQRIAGDDVFMLRWLYPSTLWKSSDVVPDVHTLLLPPTLPPGAYRLVAGAYVLVERPLPATTPTGQTVGNSATVGWVKVPQTVAPVIPDDAIPIGTTLGNSFVLKAAAGNRLPDGKVHLVLYWQSLVQRSSLDATIFVHVTDAKGTIVAQQDARPWGGQYPTFIWDQSEIVQTDYTLDLQTAALDGLNLDVGMYTLPDVRNLPVTKDGYAVPDNVVRLGPLATYLDF